VSLASYDGYEPVQALASLASVGATHAEPSYRTCGEPFDESAFSSAQARRLSSAFKASGLQCSAVFADLDLVAPEALASLRRRLGFLAELGGTHLMVPAAAVHDRRRALKALSALSPHIETLGLHVALSPGLNTGPQGLPETADLVAAAQLPWLGLDFRTDQAAQAQPGLSVADQLDAVFADCVHVHLCDVRLLDGWFPVPLGKGCVRGEQVLNHMAHHPRPLTLDLPLRLHRSRTGQLRRAPYRVPLGDIEAAVKHSLAFARTHLSSRFFH
jgi:sugar phosphate isomerase/epimerase